MNNYILNQYFDLNLQVKLYQLCLVSFQQI